MAVKRCTKHSDHECYLVDWRPEGRNGKHSQRHFKGTEAEALSFWLDMVRLSRRSRHQLAELDPKVCDLIAPWKQTYGNDHAANTVRDLKHCLVPLVRHFGAMHLSELGAPIVFDQYKSHRLATQIIPKQRKHEPDEAYQKRAAQDTRTISRRTVAKELAYFSSFLRWCKEHGHLQQPIQIKNFTAKQTKRKEAIRPLHRDDITALVNAIEPKYRPILLCMTDAGLRRSEALNLRAEQVDLRRNLIIVRGKGDKERIMVIASPRLHQALSERIEGIKKGFLFLNPKTGKPYVSIRKAILRAARAAGIDQRIYHHLMRHSFGTNAITAGVNPKALQDMMGHATFQTTELYITLAGSFLQEEGTKIGDYFDPATEQPKDEPPPKK